MQIIPILKECNKSLFVSEDIIKPSKEDINGIEVLTSYLVFNKKLDLLSISLNADLIETGYRDYTDIVNYIRLDSILYSHNDEYRILNLVDYPHVEFVNVDNQPERIRELKFNLPELNVSIYGIINIETGMVEVKYIPKDSCLLGYKVYAIKK